MADEGDTERMRLILELEAERAEKAAKRFERQVGAIERRFDPLAKATQKYERDQRALNKAHEAGKIDAERYRKALDNVEKEYADAQAAAGRATNAVNANSAAQGRLGSFMNRNRSVFQQAGYQVGDFAVQVRGGTSALTAFTQQGSQVLGVLGPYGALAGAALAIGAPLAASFLNIGGNAEEAAEGTDELTEATDKYIEAAEKARTPLSELRQDYGGLAEEIRAAAAAQAIFQERQANRKLRSEAQGVVSQFGDLSELRAPVSAASSRQRPSLASPQANLRERFGLSGGDLDKLLAALEAVELAQGPDDITEALGNLQRTMDEIGGSATTAAEQFGDAYQDVARVTKEAGRQAQVSFADADEAAKSYIGTVLELRKLEEDRRSLQDGLALAEAEGDADRAERFRAALDGVNRQYRELTEEGGDARREFERLQNVAGDTNELLAALDVDENSEIAKKIEAMRDRLREAQAEGKDLDALGLEKFQSAVSALDGLLEDVLGNLGRTREELERDINVGEAYQSYGDSRRAGRRLSRSEGMQAAVARIRSAESFEPQAYPDWSYRNGEKYNSGWRAGYGSDTYTDPATGQDYGVTEGMTVTIEQAEADLRRRVSSYFDHIIGEIGTMRFDALSGEQKGSLASLLHNYGAGEFSEGGDLGQVRSAILSGRSNAVADEIARLGSHNNGINRERRIDEAGAFGGASAPVVQSLQDEASARQEEQSELQKAEAARKRYNESLATSAERQRLEQELMGKSAAAQAEARTRFQLLNEAKRQGIDLDREMADTGMTYRQVIEQQAQAARDYAAAKEREKEAEKRARDAKREAAEEARFYDRIQRDISDGITDAIMKGESFADTLGNIAQMFAKASMQAALFGSGPFGGGGGGLLGGVFDSIAGAIGGGGASVTTSANGNIMTSDGPMPLRKYSKGGIARSPQVSIFGEGDTPEAYVPLPDGRRIPVSLDMPSVPDVADRRSAPASQGMPQQMHHTITVENGAIVGIIRDEAGRVVAKSEPATIAKAKQTVQRSMQHGRKGDWGI